MKSDPRYLELMLLSVWLGFLGADRFFLARINRSHRKWAYWKLFTLGGIGIWWLADIIYIASNRKRVQDIVDNKWQWRKYNGRISAAATVIAVLAIILALWIGPEPTLPPRIDISPKYGENGTTFNVTVGGLRPYSKITETVVRIDDQKEMQKIEYHASWWGSVDFPIPTSSFDQSDSPVTYLCKVLYGDSHISGKFTITPPVPPGGSVFVLPVPGSQGTQFIIKGYEFISLKTATYKIIKTNINKSTIITDGEINIDSEGTFSYELTGIKLDPGDYKCHITAGAKLISCDFKVEPIPPYCIVEPEEGFPTTEFNIRCKGLSARQTATYNIVILNKEWEYQFGAGQEFIDNGGGISFKFKNEQMEPGNYQCRVSDSTQTVTDNFTIFSGRCSCLCVNPKEGCCPPDFILETSNNQYVHLKHTCGKMVWIAFWQSSCSTCLDQMKIVQKAYEYWTSKELVILPINVNESPEAVRHFMDDANLTFPVLFDQDQTVTNTYVPRLYPANYFVNQNGIIKKIKYGPISSLAELRDIIDELK